MEERGKGKQRFRSMCGLPDKLARESRPLIKFRTTFGRFYMKKKKKKILLFKTG